jgi:sugar lactone lactonase YvrE
VKLRAVLLALVALCVVAAPAHAARARWNTRVLSLVPTPGFPAMAYAAPNGRVYEGTYDNPNGDHVPSRVLEIDGDGTLLRSWTMEGQDLSQPHGVQVGTSDGQGRLILLDKSPPRAIVLDPRTGSQSPYASFPAGSIPNYAAWGPDGSLYVTDYGQAILWRIPPRGGTPQPWLKDPRLDGGEFGTTGIALAADRRTLIVGMQSESGGGALNPSTGRLWKVPIQPDGTPGPMSQLWESRPADGPDGFAIAKSGNIYVALLVPNQLAVIAPDGTERERFPAAPMSGDNGSPVPFDSPSSVRFLGTRLMVANQSYFNGDRTHQAVLDVEAGEEGLPELIPAAPQSATPKAKPKKKHKAKKKHRAKKKKKKRRKTRTGRH